MRKILFLLLLIFPLLSIAQDKDTLILSSYPEKGSGFRQWTIVKDSLYIKGVDTLSVGILNKITIKEDDNSFIFKSLFCSNSRIYTLVYSIKLNEYIAIFEDTIKREDETIIYEVWYSNLNDNL